MSRAEEAIVRVQIRLFAGQLPDVPRELEAVLEQDYVKLSVRFGAPQRAFQRAQIVIAFTQPLSELISDFALELIDNGSERVVLSQTNFV